MIRLKKVEWRESKVEEDLFIADLGKLQLRVSRFWQRYWSWSVDVYQATPWRGRFPTPTEAQEACEQALLAFVLETVEEVTELADQSIVTAPICLVCKKPKAPFGHLVSDAMAPSLCTENCNGYMTDPKPLTDWGDQGFVYLSPEVKE